LDCWTSQHDPVHLLLHQCLDCHRHSEIRFARAGDADAKDDVLLLYGLNVLALVRRFRRDLFLAGRIEPSLGEVVAQAERAVFSNLRKGLTQLFVGEVFSFLEELGKIFEDALSSLDVSRIAIDRDVLSAGVNSYIEQRLEVLDVLVVNTKERLQTTRRKFNFLQTLLTFSFNHMLPQSRTKCTKELRVAAFLRLLCFFAAVMGRL